ncbi:hypothetical protein ZPAH1_orf00065 [Aeromonas phage ZPAH1]|nr:hypothetical protein ASwh1_18 [Aeromonas phage Aswh_1]QQG33827.1 hypothetical protein ZPAH1_orf00065 [Aeromonas phage ZPAH1]
MFDWNQLKWKLWSVWFDVKGKIETKLAKSVVWGKNDKGKIRVSIFGVIHITKLPRGSDVRFGK